MQQDQVTYQVVDEQRVETKTHCPAHWEEALNFTKKVQDKLGLFGPSDHQLVAAIFIALATKVPTY